MKNLIRYAASLDLAEILRIDRQVVGDQIDRTQEIDRAIRASNCRVLVSGTEIVAFAIFTPESFRGMDFLSLLVVHPARRRL